MVKISLKIIIIIQLNSKKVLDYCKNKKNERNNIDKICIIFKIILN